MLSIDGIQSCKDYHQKELENLDGGPMTSKTSAPAKYKIKIGHGNFTIIDTPGFGDSRGISTDNENFKKIQEYVKNEKGINCILVVQNGREARVST